MYTHIYFNLPLKPKNDLINSRDKDKKANRFRVKPITLQKYPKRALWIVMKVTMCRLCSLPTVLICKSPNLSSILFYAIIHKGNYMNKIVCCLTKITVEELLFCKSIMESKMTQNLPKILERLFSKKYIVLEKGINEYTDDDQSIINKYRILYGSIVSAIGYILHTKLLSAEKASSLT